MAILAIYASILALGLLLAIPRRRPLLIRGRGFFVLSALASISAPAQSWAANHRLPPGLAVACLLILIAAFLSRPCWFFLRYDTARFSSEVESALRMLLIDFSPTATGYTLKLRDAVVHVDLRRGPCRTAVLTFRETRPSRKAALLRSLLRKKFDPLFPRPRFRLG